MRLKEALALRLANGSTIAETSADVLAAELEEYRRELGAFEAQGGEAMSEEEGRRTRARLRQMREFSRAIEIVKRHQRLHAI
jgi:hypothetical protein